jgi:hypothetical protein
MERFFNLGAFTAKRGFHLAVWLDAAAQLAG